MRVRLIWKILIIYYIYGLAGTLWLASMPHRPSGGELLIPILPFILGAVVFFMTASSLYLPVLIPSLAYFAIAFSILWYSEKGKRKREETKNVVWFRNPEIGILLFIFFISSLGVQVCFGIPIISGISAILFCLYLVLYLFLSIKDSLKEFRAKKQKREATENVV